MTEKERLNRKYKLVQYPLFVIYINDLDLNVDGLMCLHGDDVKIDGVVDTVERSKDIGYRPVGDLGEEITDEI